MKENFGKVKGMGFRGSVPRGGGSGHEWLDKRGEVKEKTQKRLSDGKRTLTLRRRTVGARPTVAVIQVIQGASGISVTKASIGSNSSGDGKLLMTERGERGRRDVLGRG